jgi:hypothetical protein
MRLPTQPMNPARSSRDTHRRNPVRALAVALVVAIGSQNGRLVAQGLNGDGQEGETIRGTVVNSLTHEPIAGALVYSPDSRFAMRCDNGGHFEFKIPRAMGEGTTRAGIGLALPAAADGNQPGDTPSAESPIQLMARKPGFLSGENSPYVTYLRQAEQEITIRLAPEALIVGNVNLPTTDGTDKLQIELYRREIVEGRETWNSAGLALTRSNEEFRFAELAAGTYKLFTHEQLDRDPLTFDPRGQLYGYAPLFYPSSNDFASASPIQVTAGTTVNVNLSPRRRQYYPIKLALRNLPQGVGGVQTEVWPQGHPGPGFSLGYDQDQQTIAGLLPNGNYTVQVNTLGAIGSSGQININVKGAGVEGAAVNLVPNRSMRVNLKSEFSSRDTASQIAGVEENGKVVSKNQMIMRSMQVTLISVDEFHAGNGIGTRPPDGPNDDWAMIDNVQPGRYWVQVISPVGYVASVTSGGSDLLHNPLVVPPGGTSSPIEITVRDEGATVEGAIENWGEQTEGGNFNRAPRKPACVYLVPIAGVIRQPLITWTTPEGDFTLEQIPPGAYRAMAFDRQPGELEFRNEEGMKKYEAKSRLIQLEAGQKEQLSLQLNSAGE